MAHTAQPDGPPHRTREIIIGVLALVVAIPVIVVLILALRHPDGRKAVDSTVGASSANSVVAPSTGASGSATSKPAQSASTTAPSSVQTSTSTTPVAPNSPSTSTSASTSPSPSVVAGRLPVIVLNNTAASGATSLAISRFQAGGWTATDGGTFDGDILSTVAYYDPDADGSKAAALALQRQFPAIQRVVPAFTGLPSGPVVVVLTSDYH